MMLPVFLGAFASPDDLPKGYDRLFVCIGRSNVGKSSLVNALTKSSISRTSRTPGRTQTINAFSVGPKTMLVDLPGYGFAKHAQEKRALLETRIYDTLTKLAPTSIFLLIDAYVGLTRLDTEMLTFLNEEGLPYVVLANKVDRLNQKERALQERAIRAELGAHIPVVFCSSVKETGLGDIRELLNRMTKKTPS